MEQCKYKPALKDNQCIDAETDFQEVCKQHMTKNGLPLPENELIRADGVFHRYSIDNSPNNPAEWYVAHIVELDDGNISFNCTYGSFKLNVKYTYSSYGNNSKIYTDEERKEFKNLSRNHKNLTDNLLKEQHDRAAKIANQEWQNAWAQIPRAEDPSHLPSYDEFDLYPRKKGIKAFGARYGNNPFDRRGSLIIPVINIAGEIRSLQYIWIDENKSAQKRFPKWGETKGLFFILGKPINGEPITVTEGYATAASIFEAKEEKEVVIAALSVGNVVPVIEILKKKYPKSLITIAADNDIGKVKNAGKEAAYEASQIFSCRVVLPNFPEDKNCGPDGKPYSDFNDLHKSCGIDEVKKQLKLSFNPAKKLIVMDDESKLSNILDESEKALIDNTACEIYQRNGELVRIIKVPSQPIKYTTKLEQKKIIREGGGTIIKSVDKYFLVEQLTRFALFQKQDMRSHKYKNIYCPPKYAEHLLSRGEWGIRYLSGIINAPIMLTDGSIIETPGYDEKTGLFFDPNGTVFGKTPENPSQTDIDNAKTVINSLLEGFPFVSEIDKAVAVAALFTSIMRATIKTAPIFAFSAPQRATGKSLLCDAAAILATGKSVPKITYTGDDTEDQKLLLAILDSGDSIACYDNISQPFGFDALDMVITEASHKGRRLGKTEKINIENIKTTFFANGNNLRIKGDTTERALLCIIDSKQERPGERKYDIDLRKHIFQNRASIVTAFLAIARAYLYSKEKVVFPRFGRFEEWDQAIRAPIIWAGYADPYLSKKEIDDADPEREELGALLIALHKNFGSGKQKTSDMIRAARPDGDETQKSLYDALVTITGEPINAKKLGNKLKYYKDRPEGGYVLTIDHKNEATVWWAVKKL